MSHAGQRQGKRGGQSSALRAFTTGAMALIGNPGSASADMPVTRPLVDYNYSIYTEDDLGRTKGLPLAQRERYEIEMHQFVLQAPLPFTEHADFGFEVVHETMSGASPFYVVPDAAGTPIQVMSGATIDEERLDLLVHGNYYYDNARLGLAGGFSTENDYSAINLSTDGETHFNEGNTTVSSGLGFSLDRIEPTDASSTRPDKENKWSASWVGGLSQILDRKTLVQTSLTYKHSHGYLSDPYKAEFVVGGTFLPDSRPDTRNQLSWLTRYRHHVEELDGTLHLNYQFYLDDWDITSHTLEMAWHQSLWNSVSIVPSLRYYTQSEADFYVPFFNISPGLGQEHSSDYRLSAYGALTLGLKGEYVFRTPWTGDREWRATVAWERYMSSSDLSHSEPSTEAPGLVSFNVITFGFSVRY